MSKFNADANDPTKAAITKAWVEETSPLTYVYGPSGTGKTTWLGSLFPSYKRVLMIDADASTSPIEQFTRDARLCEWRPFDDDETKLVPWFYKQLDASKSFDCNAIVIEGFTAVFNHLVAAELAATPSAVGPALMRAYIGPSSRVQGIIESIRNIKRARRAKGIGCPIIVTLNTKTLSVEAGKIDGPKKVIPDWSENLSDRAMRTADAFLEMSRSPAGVKLAAQATPENKLRKVRQHAVAVEIEKQTDLNLPGLLTLWAMTVDAKTRSVSAAMDKQEAKGAE